MGDKQMIQECRDCPHWHRDKKKEDWPWDSPWGDCDLMPEDRNPLIEYDKPGDCPKEANT